MRELKYRVNKDINDTKCKYFYGNIRVGEFLCIRCSHFLSENYSKKIVRCLADESFEENKKYIILLTEKEY